MCGICGILGNADKEIVAKMLDLIAHRGPDDSGIYIGQIEGSKRVGLGHRRLSIIDLSPSGHQPMSFAEESLWLVYNGEIYNFHEIKAELELLGHRFRSKTDSEVILAAYKEWGEKSVEKFNGMFAFALWDAPKQKLFAARDRLGIKPFYYTESPQGFAFASEVKALLAIEGVEKTLDLNALHQYLTFLWVPDPKTMFKGIYKLPPAHYLTYQHGKIEIKEYWDIRFEEDRNRGEAEWAELLRESLRKAVASQMISDVPLGAFLSGGVDSSSIVALMTELSSNPVHTYTVGFKTADLAYDIIPDDVRYAREVGKLFETSYNEAELEPEVFDLLPKLIWHMDEPIADPAIITSYLICRSARQTLTVLLSGMGGDEVFAGYPRHLAVRLADIYNFFPSVLTDSFVSLLPASRPGPLNAVFRNINKLAKSAAMPFHNRYLGYGTYFTDQEKAALYSGDFQKLLLGFDAYEQHRKFYSRASNAHWINQMLYIDLKLFLPCLNLTYTDKTSMASSLEVRVPFLDHKLVELAAQIPAELKLRRFTRKYILKRAVEPLLPKSIIHRKKAGFSAPLRAWLRRDFAEMVEETLSTETVKARGLFDPKEIRRLIDANNSGREDNSLKIFQLLTLELWQQRFLDN